MPAAFVFGGAARLWEQALPGSIRARMRRSIAYSGEQLGGAKLKALVWTALLIFLVYAAFKIIPLYVAQYQLSDRMQEEARFAIVNRYNEDQIRDTIYREVQDLEIPVKKEEIKVLVSPAVVRISLDYTVPVDLLVYKTNFHFTPSSENKALWTP